MKNKLFVVVAVLCILAIIFLICYIGYTINNPKIIKPKTEILKSEPHVIDTIMPILIELESGGDSLAKGTSNDLGILQITPICVKDYNIHSGDSLKHSDMIHPHLSKRVYNFQMHRLYGIFCKKFGHEPTEAQVVSFWNGRRYNQSYVDKYFVIKSRD